jgi:hypothetical protein
MMRKKQGFVVGRGRPAARGEGKGPLARRRNSRKSSFNFRRDRDGLRAAKVEAFVEIPGPIGLLVPSRHARLKSRTVSPSLRVAERPRATEFRTLSERGVGITLAILKGCSDLPRCSPYLQRGMSLAKGDGVLDGFSTRAHMLERDDARIGVAECQLDPFPPLSVLAGARLFARSLIGPSPSDRRG